MLDEKGISERNQKVIKFISGLKLGLHIIGLPENPRFLSSNYQYILHGYVKNFKIMLYNQEFNGDLILECRVDADPEEYRERFVEWMAVYEHKRIYTLCYGDLFLAGYGHQDKINKLNPFPVFAKFFPHFYYEREKAEELQARYKEYELEIK